MKYTKTALTTILGLGLAATGLSIASASPDTSSDRADRSAASDLYTAGKDDRFDTDAFIKTVLKSALEKKENAKDTKSAGAVTVTYSAKNAPHFRAQIKRSASIWNAAVDNVKLREGGNPDFTYREGNDDRGSWARPEGNGKGLVFLDFKQNREFDSTRVAAHETGHILGLPDNRTGQCSDLMSGGSAPASCKNAKPSSEEAREVDQQWAQGLEAVNRQLAADNRR
ncbi:snapalysin family zinc-dependent metalloprotease [Streptomyces sp. NEAU-Y11]|uniref:snapalysin family zinc-dependent metalloprotease n=1 Tax=Streptomyces cucumeris TaxID=2962890 RepID=UPI0020C8C323|nr:snapalysin family zinc-dependent metalloprotease [Streptomyces sp. NEAU-Y11]MCP9206735.1 snapalysin family zinc-dependent metalloprotease [Streptomyces sp. NEAU-Y11]